MLAAIGGLVILLPIAWAFYSRLIFDDPFDEHGFIGHGFVQGTRQSYLLFTACGLLYAGLLIQLFWLNRGRALKP
jgi:hypothetical protein